LNFQAGSYFPSEIRFGCIVELANKKKWAKAATIFFVPQFLETIPSPWNQNRGGNMIEPTIEPMG